jgi:putative membrane-bound dehydrogenase-like protein
MRHCLLLLSASLSFLVACGPRKPTNTDVSAMGANKEVIEHLQRFEGRGALTDESKPLPPQKALETFQTASDLRIDLVLSEPRIFQPVEMKFDRKGRLWVVQYNQYPYPKGLKITGVDNHLRLQFDNVPAPPPNDVKGADRITFFEDTDGDGTFDRSTDAISGLNITTSVLLGKKRIWVLSPPYLLAYWDKDGDGIPEGEPEVHLSGFGLEDTHAVANSMRWGPDGWIYGAQGSTTTANITSKVSKNVSFSGQAIWRYHPETHQFEIYGEGGGNTFNVEIDSEGKVYSGQNGYGRGPYYKQGAYYKKAWGKHGPLTNPYAFGFLPDMAFEGENSRFTHALIRYEGGALPDRFAKNFVALNPLQGNIMLTEVEKDGSSLKNKDLEKLVDTPDRWFRPIDIKSGPDGNVYFTDWYDSRLSHVDARDTWNKTTGRIYRLSAKAARSTSKFIDFTRLATASLIHQFYSPNKWVRFTALEELGDRGDRSVAPTLLLHLKSDTSKIALESLWALHQLSLFDEKIAILALEHTQPLVREWGVRLIGDRKQASEIEAKALIALAAKESDTSVRSQLAASAKRLPGALCMAIVHNLVVFHDDLSDPDIPLMLWWALESKAESDRELLVKLFSENAFLERPIATETLLERIVQRYTMAAGEENYSAANEIIQQPLNALQLQKALTGLEEGLRGIAFNSLPEKFRKSVDKLKAAKGEPELSAGLRKRQPESIQKAKAVIASEKSSLTDRLTYIRILGENDIPEGVPTLLSLLSSASASGAIKQAALSSLGRYENAEIGERVVKLYPDILRADPDVRLAALSVLTSRPEWAKSLLASVQGIKTIKPEEISMEMVNRIKQLGSPELTSELHRIWPMARETSGSERQTRISLIQKILKDGNGVGVNGKELYINRCGACHKLFGEGEDIGPELTGYDRRDVNYFILNTVDPNADIREGYATYTLKTKTGQTIVGRLIERSGQTVKIKPMTGEAITLSMKEVDALEPLPVSLMPERLLDDLSEQQIRDLFQYIKEGV